MDRVAPTVTVLVAAYEAEAFIHRAVASALEQAGPSLEVLVVDDGSTDGTSDAVRALAVADPRVRLVTLARNGGPSAARNAGIDAARGRWIAVLDADDTFAPGRLETLVGLGEEHDADLVADAFSMVDVASGVVSPLPFRTDVGVRRLDLHTFLDQSRPDAPEPDFGLLKPVLRASFVRAAGLRYPEHSRHGEDFLLVTAALRAGAVYLLSPTTGYLQGSRASGWSRTTLDYAGVAAQSKALLNAPGIAEDPRARALLRRRIRALDRMAERKRVTRMLGERDHWGLLRAALARPRTAMRLARLAAGRVRGAGVQEADAR